MFTRKKPKPQESHTFHNSDNTEETPFKTVSYASKKAEDDRKIRRIETRTYKYEGPIEIRINIQALAETYTYYTCQEIIEPNLNFLEEFCRQEFEYNKNTSNAKCDRRLEGDIFIATYKIATTHENQSPDQNEALSTIKEMYETCSAHRLSRKIVNVERISLTDYNKNEQVSIDEIPKLTIPEELSITITPEAFKQQPATPTEQALQTIRKLKQQ